MTQITIRTHVILSDDIN